MDLVEFLRDRLDEDERVAQQAGGKAWAWEQHQSDMCNDPTCPYGELATDEAVLMSVHGYDVKDDWQGAAHIARHNPARVLAEVDAKRQVVDAYLPPGESPHPGLPCTNSIKGDPNGKHYDEYDSCARHLDATEKRFHDDYLLRLLALPYADHPDYREEWRP